MRAVAAAIMVAGTVVLAEPASAATVPLAGGQVFVQTDAPSPLVRAAVVDEFGGADGTDLDGWTDTVGGTWTVLDGGLAMTGGAVHLSAGSAGRAALTTGETDVLLAADLVLPDADRSSGVILGHGASGELRVEVRRDGADSAVAVVLDDAGSESTLTTATAVGSGLPATASLRVEHRGGRLRAWLDGVAVVDLTLAGAALSMAVQPAQGVVVGRAGDSIESLVVLAPQG